MKAASLTGFGTYELTVVQVTDRELGHGCYATVLELEYMGLKCAGKKIHELLLNQGDISYTLHRFEKNVIYSVKYATPISFSFLESISRKECEYPS